MNNITYRRAYPTEAAEIAKLINMASGGMIDFLFHDLTTDLTTLEIITMAVENQVGELSYRQIEVAIFEEMVVGIANSYSATKHQITDSMKTFFPPDRLAVVREFYETSIEDSYYLNALAVLPEYRRQSIGKALISRIKKKGINLGFSDLSVIVWTDNTEAIIFYKNQSFREVKSIPIIYHPLLPHSEGCILMCCPLY
ncbi:MAG: GNAT family N-acetyltransferase [Microcoleaceae cyanobacterium]